MKTFKIKVFDHTNTSQWRWDDFFKRANTCLQIGGVQLIPVIEKVARRSPVFSPIPSGIRYHIDEQWFKETFSVRAIGFDFALAYFDKNDWKKPHKKNDLGGQSLNQHYGVSEIAMFGSFFWKANRPLAPNFTESEALTRFLHEFSHSIFDHKLIQPDVTHEYHYNRGNLLEAFTLWNFMTDSEKLGELAKSLLGTDVSPKDLVSDAYGCAETMSNLIKQILPDFRIVTGTWSLYDQFEWHPRFVRVQKPQKNDIVLCVTGMGNGKVPNGHVGIYLTDTLIASNDSDSGLFQQNYTHDSWNQNYSVKGGYPLFYYRLL